MLKVNGPPILVTGSHRSGSTWTGKMIASSPRVGYIWEPLNPAHKRGIFEPRTNHYYSYISGHNGGIYEPAMRKTLAFNYNLAAQLRSIHTPRDFFQMCDAFPRSLLYRLQDRRPLLKDPMALFSAEWIASQFGAQVVVLIRHPAAFVSSLIKASWRHLFSNFLSQPELMAEQLSPFEDEIRRYVRADGGILDESILLWRITHHVIANHRRLHPDWLFVRHEDLSRDPVVRFQPVFDFLGLEYTPQMKRIIDSFTRPGNPVERPGEIWPPFARLDSRKNVDRWATRLTSDQITYIRHRTEDVWPEFYGEDDWPSGAASETSLAEHPFYTHTLAER